MDIDEEDVTAFVHAGTVAWDPIAAKLMWSWKPTVPDGFVVYLMVVNREVRKAGKAEETPTSTFKRRVEGEFRTVGQVIRGPIPGRRLANWRTKKLDPFKQNAPPVLLAGHRVDVYARACRTWDEMKREEGRLLNKYRGDWTQEGWTRDGRRRYPETGTARSGDERV
jgi:hypothetical protein